MKMLEHFVEHIMFCAKTQPPEQPEPSKSRWYISQISGDKEDDDQGIMQRLDSSHDGLVSALVAGRTIAAAAAYEGPYSCEFGSFKYFALCGLGGILSCGITHTMVTPLDLVKCRIQVDKAKYGGLFKGLGITFREEGAAGLARGWAPTFIGYSFQGMAKFGLYEYFKVVYGNILGPEKAFTYRAMMWLAASASAEFFADILLSPFESMKVRIQTKVGYASTMRECYPRIISEEGFGALYKSLVPLWMRQIPYTMMKFGCFEKAVELILKNVVHKSREQCTKAEQLVVTFAAGYIAGVFCAIVSHPADVVVSKMSQDKTASAGDILKKLGFGGIWGGLGTRIIMIGTLSALQWFIYDGFKVSMRMPRPPVYNPEKK